MSRTGRFSEVKKSQISDDFHEGANALVMIFLGARIGGLAWPTSKIYQIVFPHPSLLGRKNRVLRPFDFCDDLACACKFIQPLIRKGPPGGWVLLNLHFGHFREVGDARVGDGFLLSRPRHSKEKRLMIPCSGGNHKNASQAGSKTKPPQGDTPDAVGLPGNPGPKWNDE